MIKEVIFVVDPMCSWCWGFSPVLEVLKNESDYKVSLVLGGLRTSGDMFWDLSSKAYLKQHWKQVEETTGQPFSYVLFEKEAFDYNTYPACKAVVSVRELFGIQNAFSYLHVLQEAFYTRGEDITRLDTLIRLLQRLDMDLEKFETFYSSQRAEILMHHDFAKARSMGANAFPSMVMIDQEGHMICQKGYRSLEEIQTLLKDSYA